MGIAMRVNNTTRQTGLMILKVVGVSMKRADTTTTGAQATEDKRANAHMMTISAEATMEGKVKVAMPVRGATAVGTGTKGVTEVAMEGRVKVDTAMKDD